MKTLFLLSAAMVALAGCNGEKSATNAANTTVTAEPVAPPADGDWSTVVAMTPEGGFRMGNPNAKVQLVEFGSMSCPHCAEFDEKGVPPLIDNYVKKGLVAFEFRNFVRDGFDMTASLVARCGGENSFFGLTRGLYAEQRQLMQNLQDAGPEFAQSLQGKSPQEQFVATADKAGFLDFAAMRGLPKDKARACLADASAADRLVTMNSDAVAQYNITGTPSFAINGELVEMNPGSPPWTQLEAAIRKTLG